MGIDFTWSISSSDLKDLGTVVLEADLGSELFGQGLPWTGLCWSPEISGGSDIGTILETPGQCAHLER